MQGTYLVIPSGKQLVNMEHDLLCHLSDKRCLALSHAVVPRSTCFKNSRLHDILQRINSGVLLGGSCSHPFLSTERPQPLLRSNGINMSELSRKALEEWGLEVGHAGKI